MSLDTRNKRASAIGVLLPFNRVFPNPDGSLTSVEDRQQMALSYAGNLAAATAGGLLIGSSIIGSSIVL